MRRLTQGILLTLMLALATSLAITGCGGGKTAATAAVATAQTAFDAVKGDAAKVLPEQTQKLADAFATAKTNIDEGKYKEAMDAAQALPVQVKDLADAAAKKKDELTATWTSMSTVLPAAMTTVQDKLDAVAKMHKLPAGLDTAKLGDLQTSLATTKQVWDDAQAAFKSGNLADAVAKLGAIRQGLVSAMTALGLPVPAALQTT